MKLDSKERGEAFLKKDRFASDLGIEMVAVSPGYAKVKLAVTEQHLNGLKWLHGGAIFTLADFAFAAASNSYGTVAVALNVNISFLKGIQGGILLAEAKEVSKSRKIATYEVTVVNESEELIATFQGMAYRMDGARKKPAS